MKTYYRDCEFTFKYICKDLQRIFKSRYRVIERLKEFLFTKRIGIMRIYDYSIVSLARGFVIYLYYYSCHHRKHIEVFIV